MLKTHARPRGGKLGLLLATLVALPGLAHASNAIGLYYERTVMREADGRCRLFAPEISAALAASSLQARGAALRSGANDGALTAAADRARLAAFSVACNSPDLGTAANRVRKAFEGYARMSSMRFPGDLSAWQADREPTAPVVDRKAVEGPRWKLSAPGQWDGAGAGQLTLGITTAASVPTVAISKPSALQAATAVLIVRDTSKATQAYLDPRRRDLVGHAPPRDLTRSFLAQSRQAAPASLLPGGQGAGAMFTFPPAAARAMEGLDPREAVTVEFIYSGLPSQRAVFEVGDFAAARAFLMAGR